MVFLQKWPEHVDHKDPNAIYWTPPGSEDVNMVYVSGPGGQPDMGEHSGFVLFHEYVHYLQAVRSLPGMWLVGSCVSMLQWIEEIRRVLAQTRGRPAREAIFELPTVPAAIALNTFQWHYQEGNQLSVGDIQESEAELISQFVGKNAIRFRYYASGVRLSLVTAHFERLRQTKPGYAGAFLKAEAAFGELTPALFPLLAYFSLSMPLKTLTEDGCVPVAAEVAFDAGIKFLQKNKEFVADHYHYAYDLCRKKDFALDPARDRVHEFGQKVCAAHDWIYSDLATRRIWAQNLRGLNEPVSNRVALVCEKALALEERYGPILFLEPWSPPCSTILLSELPLPFIFTPGRTPSELCLHDAGFWGRDFVDAALFVRSMAGATYRAIGGIVEPTGCPHREICPFAKAALCNDYLPFPATWEECLFPSMFENWFGMDLKSFVPKGA